MTVQLVRLVLKPANVDADEADERQIVLDLSLDSDTGMSAGPFPAFGRVGDYRKPETLFPFTLMMDGRMDTGAYAAEQERNDMLEIRKASLEEGGIIVRRSGDTAADYVIESVTPLIAG